MQIMEKLTESCILHRPTGKLWTKNMMGFVDDTRKFNNQNSIATSLEENVIMDVKK